MDRSESYRFRQGGKILPFSEAEYEVRLTGLRKIMADQNIDACILNSMHKIADYSGFLYCALGRPYTLLVTETESILVSAGIDAAQPWRRCFGDNIVYTDWQHSNYWGVPKLVIGTGQRIVYEGDQLSIAQMTGLKAYMIPRDTLDIAPAAMTQHLKKSPAAIELILAGAAIADVGGYAIRDASA